MLAKNDSRLLVEGNAIRADQVHQPESIMRLTAYVGRICASEAALLEKYRESVFGIPLPDYVRGNVAEKEIALTL
jgi:hypothetical protein